MGIISKAGKLLGRDLMKFKNKVAAVLMIFGLIGIITALSSMTDSERIAFLILPSYAQTKGETPDETIKELDNEF